MADIYLSTFFYLSISSLPVYVNSQVQLYAFLLHDAMIKPIPKGSKHPFPSANYRGIELASSHSKLLKWLILVTWGHYFTTIVIFSLGLNLAFQLLSAVVG